ncbi:M23 family metallopeptidase [Methylobacterium pseudosasicola]|uniref:Murein DD-endopeptidase MepM and murein hydrolase activator NlpD, contain LysM domain n=1 Tax=Methylobacterium pseudosasicola TaxID=582667 RepID=A0A1I4F8U4_9HYPH|nr:M23 family metallopeptidase [Methylobacterium pseudosasicola]SFL13873.1 Murein DD-endopeptidase MepM and murein hydrolase activator NlpD, contain LysM domain [Methylobacterium pseudosasicola]
MRIGRLKIGKVATAAHEGGVHAPLQALGAHADRIDRRAVNLHWLCASTLAGLIGAGLLAAALRVSLQEDGFVPIRPEFGGNRSRSGETGSNGARKGDRLVRNLMIASAKQSFRASVTVRLGDHEIIKAKAFVRSTTPLSLTTGVYAGEPPRFDPMKFVSDEPLERAPDTAVDAPGAEVTVIKRDLADAAVPPNAPALTDDDVTAQVEEERRITAEAGRRAAIPLAPQILLSRALQQGATAGSASKDVNPFKAIEVLVVPENVTKIPKVELKPNEPPLVEERKLALRRGETLEVALKAAGLAGDEQIRGIVAALGGKARIAALAEGQPMQVQVAPGPYPGDPRQVTRVILYGESGIEGIAALNDRGAFVSVAPPTEEAPSPQPHPQAEVGEDENEDSGSGPRLYQSLYETAARYDLPRATVEDIVRVFSYDLDFQRRIASGDGLDVFYTYDDETGAERPDLLYAALTLGGETHKVYRFQSPDDGTIDYLDDQGRSLKKFLLRKPVATAVMSSSFGYRRHPILGYAKLHTGVDWASPVGTPVLAAGNGIVARVKNSSSYGNHVEIQHVNGYVTAYNHMSRIGAGVREGARIRQGQVVGYVGSTGLSTGAHLHYEVIINGHFVDPMKIRLPRGRELDGRLLAEFNRQREQADATMQTSKSATLLAQRGSER